MHPLPSSPSRTGLSGPNSEVACFRRCNTDPSVPSVRFDKQAAWDQRKSAMLRLGKSGKSPKQVKRIRRRQSLPQTESSTRRDSPKESSDASQASLSRWESSPRRAQRSSPSLRKPTRGCDRTSNRCPTENKTESPRMPSRVDHSVGTESPRKPTRRNSSEKGKKKQERSSPFQVTTMPSMQTERRKQSCLQGLESLKKMRNKGFGSLAA